MVGRFAGGALLCAGLLASGCVSKLTGNEGNLDFSYTADEDVRNFNKPIAVGAKLDVSVAETGSGGAVTLLTATTDVPQVLKVDSFSGKTMVLEGTGSGEALVSVSARTSTGATKSDEVNMMARVPEVLRLVHNCTTANAALYPVNADTTIGYDMQMSNGLAVIGYGLFPVTVEPASLLTIDTTSKDQSAFHVKMSGTPQSGTLRSKIDTTSLQFTVVTEASIDGALIENQTVRTLPGGVGLYPVSPTVGGKQICQANTAFSVQTSTPSNCSVEVAARTVQVHGIAAGSCTFTVRFAAGNSGAGASGTATVPISSP